MIKLRAPMEKVKPIFEKEEGRKRIAAPTHFDIKVLPLNPTLLSSRTFSLKSLPLAME